MRPGTALEEPEACPLCKPNRVGTYDDPRLNRKGLQSGIQERALRMRYQVLGACDDAAEWLHTCVRRARLAAESGGEMSDVEKRAWYKLGKQAADILLRVGVQASASEPVSSDGLQTLHSVVTGLRDLMRLRVEAHKAGVPMEDLRIDISELGADNSPATTLPEASIPGAAPIDVTPRPAGPCNHPVLSAQREDVWEGLEADRARREAKQRRGGGRR